MRIRHVKIYSGQEFTIPQGIQRIDTRSTHGWQVRYQGTKFFSDGPPADGSGAKKSLDNAMRELARRMETMPPPVVLKRGPSAHKNNDLPPGISGPIEQRRENKVPTAVLSVLLPRYGQSPRVKSIYIGSIRTYTKTRLREAIKRAVALRAEALTQYEADAVKSKRKQAREMRAAVRASLNVRT
jgi:hypothetical protein